MRVFKSHFQKIRIPNAISLYRAKSGKIEKTRNRVRHLAIKAQCHEARSFHKYLLRTCVLEWSFLGVRRNSKSDKLKNRSCFRSGISKQPVRTHSRFRYKEISNESCFYLRDPLCWVMRRGTQRVGMNWVLCPGQASKRDLIALKHGLEISTFLRADSRNTLVFCSRKCTFLSVSDRSIRTNIVCCRNMFPNYVLCVPRYVI